MNREKTKEKILKEVTFYSNIYSIRLRHNDLLKLIGSKVDERKFVHPKETMNIINGFIEDNKLIELNGIFNKYISRCINYEINEKEVVPTI